MTRQHRVDEFCKLFSVALVEAITNHPDEYCYPIENVPVVVERMRSAFMRDSYNHDSRAIKATCKQLGIKHTHKAIEAYFNT